MEAKHTYGKGTSQKPHSAAIARDFELYSYMYTACHADTCMKRVLQHVTVLVLAMARRKVLRSISLEKNDS
jgi:hypothetical protein